MSISNTQILLASRPQGEPSPANFRVVKSTIPKDIPQGHLLVRNLFLSIDPTMRNWMNADKNSYSPPVEIGEVFRSIGLGEVIESKSPKFKKGDLIHGLVGLQEYAILKDDSQMLYKIQENLLQQIPLTKFLSVLGMPGLTAYFGMNRIAELKQGETVLISGAAGAVGAVAGQIAKFKGCRVVGITGADDKVNFITKELGFDAAINYKKVQNISEEIKRHCPKGVDVYWDNVGGEMLDAALENINMFARIVLCGAISQYNVDMDRNRIYPLKNYLMIFKKRAKMQGFIVFDFYDDYEQALREMVEWVKQKKIKHREEIIFGLENAPQALQNVLKGETQGKVIAQITKELPPTAK